jgi:oligopeptide transport system ATP-binding protein
VNALEVKGLVKRFPLGEGRLLTAVDGIDFDVAEGETVGLVGESGSGKTTVGRCILGLLEPSDGEILVAGQAITALEGAALRGARSAVQMVFQEPYGSLNPRWSTGKTIDEPLRRLTGLGKSERRDRVREVLELVGLSARHLHSYPHELTSSEQQRVGIARAIATSPKLVVLDEPTSTLDVRVRADMLQLLQALQHELGVSYVLISHDLTAIGRISHRIAVMYLGRIVEMAQARELFAFQAQPYSRALLSSVLRPSMKQTRQELELRGEIPSAVDLPPGCSLAGRCPLAIDRCRIERPPLGRVGDQRWSACHRADELVAMQANGHNPTALEVARAHTSTTSAVEAHQPPGGHDGV